MTKSRNKKNSSKRKSRKTSIFLHLFLLILLVLTAAGLVNESLQIRGQQEDSLAITTGLSHGPIVGNTTSTSATVWFRTASSSAVSVKIGTTKTTLSPKGPSVNTTPENDFTGKLDLTGLSPNTRYFYNLVVNGTATFTQTNLPFFKTFPQEESRVPSKLVVLTDFCCFGTRTPAPSSTFLNAGKENPDLVLIGGDFDHRNPDGTTNTQARANKRQMFKDLYGMAKYKDFVLNILRKYSVAHVWDDHDFGKNNADKSYPRKAMSLEILNEYFPTYPMTQLGDWQKFRFAQTEIFMLDSRSQRDPNKETQGPDKSMLDGDNLGSTGQLEWLKQGLVNSSAIWKIIFTPSVFNPTSNKADTWYNYADERQTLLDFINTNSVANVVMISGDMHGGGIDNGTNAGVAEMMVPNANLPRHIPGCISFSTLGTWSEGTYGSTSTPKCQGYGVIEIGTSPDTIRLTVKDDLGNTKLTYKFSAGANTPTPIPTPTPGENQNPTPSPTPTSQSLIQKLSRRLKSALTISKSPSPTPTVSPSPAPTKKPKKNKNR